MKPFLLPLDPSALPAIGQLVVVGHRCGMVVTRIDQEAGVYEVSPLRAAMLSQKVGNRRVRRRVAARSRHPGRNNAAQKETR